MAGLFEAVYQECQSVIRKYYACYPLLGQMATLLLNHCVLAEDAQQQLELVRESSSLCERVRAESDQGELIVWVTGLQAACALALNEPRQALELLGAETEPMVPFDPLRADAFVRLGESVRAAEILQIGIYQHALVLSEMLAQLLTLFPDQEAKFREAANRLCALDAAFELRKLHPGVMVNLYLQQAIGYAALHLHADAVAALKVCLKILADAGTFALHGDAFFDHIDGWLKQKADTPPISKQTMGLQVLELITTHHAFAALSGDSAYQQIKRDATNMKEQLV